MKNVIKLFAVLICLLLAVSIATASCNNPIPEHFIGKNVDELMALGVEQIAEGDFVDEDESGAKTEEWFLTLTNGEVITAFSQNRLVNELRIVSTNFVTSRGVKVADSLSRVKEKYPNSTFPNGSTDTLSQSNKIHLLTKDGKLIFIFDSAEISKQLESGSRYNIDQKEIKDLKVWAIIVI